MSGHVTPLTTTTLDVSTPSAAHTRPPLGVKTSFSPLKTSSLPSSPSPPPPTSAYPYLAPLISRLPPELLHLVFELVKSEVCAEYEAAPTEKEGNKKPDWMAWRAVTQVCQRWRRIALASSTLWREIKFRRVGLPWGLEMLSRARSAPLKIELGHAPGYPGFPDEYSSLTFASQLLEDEGHRLQTFTLFGVDMEVVAAMLFVAEDGKYKCLEDLQVETRWDDVRVSFETLRRTMPRLRELRLYGPIITRAPTAPLHYLTHLNLQHDPKPPTDDPPIPLSTGILLPEILRALPVLVDLQLTDVFPPEDMLNSTPPIPLARTCQTISLTTRKSYDRAVNFSRLLHHATAVREYVLETCSPSQLSSLLSSYAGPDRAPSPTQVGIVIGYPKKSVTVSVCYEPWMRNPPIDARLPRHAFSVTFSDKLELWSAMCSSIDFRNVQDVAFEDDSSVEVVEGEELDEEEEEVLEEGAGMECLVEIRRERKRMRWMVFLGAPVRRIRVTGSACRTLFSILSSPPECTLCHSPSTTTTTTTTKCDHLTALFPLLTELCVVESVERPGIFGPAPFVQGKDLVEAVRNRQRRCGGLIKEVKVPDRFLYDAWVDEVLGEVGRVSNSRYRYF